MKMPSTMMLTSQLLAVIQSRTYSDGVRDRTAIRNREPRAATRAQGSQCGRDR